MTIKQQLQWLSGAGARRDVAASDWSRGYTISALIGGWMVEGRMTSMGHERDIAI